MSLRNETKGWPKRGPSQDGGAGSNAKKLLSEMSDEHRQLVRDLYPEIVLIVKGKPGPVQRAVLSAAASNYKLSFIETKADETPAGADQPTIMVEAFARAQAEAAENPERNLSFNDYAAMTQRHAKVISDERKVAREAAEARKAAKTETSGDNGSGDGTETVEPTETSETSENAIAGTTSDTPSQ